MSVRDELELLAKDVEEAMVEALCDGSKGDARMLMSITARIRHAAKRLDVPADETITRF